MILAARARRLRVPLIVALLSLIGPFLAPALARASERHATRRVACRVHSRRERARRRPAARRCQRVNTRRVGTLARKKPPTSPPPPPPPPPPPGSSSPSIYWGSTIGSQFTGSTPPWDMTALSDFENTDAGGKQTSIVDWGSTFYSSAYCGGYCTFTTSEYEAVRTAGMIPWISWATESSAGESGYTDAQIAAGSQDGYITQWAQAAKAWGHPFFLRFDWEMNANWSPWGVGANGNTAADYVAMWRHVHDIFTSVGATNATWVWCPNIDPSNALAPMATLYPGDAYVDWTCLDGYNGDDPWTSFQNLFQSSYDQITGTIASSKPLIVGETGSTESGGSKAQWITSMLSGLPTTFPKIHGFLWYDVTSPGPGGHSDWPIESSSTAEAAFASGISSPAFVANNYANLSASPIPPPA